VGPVKSGDSTLVELSCMGDDVEGQQLQVLLERELDGHILSGEDWGAIAPRGFDPPKRFAV
jgi:hypothetical protein